MTAICRMARPRAAHGIMAILVSVLLAATAGRAPAAVCAGDCDADGTVTIEELVIVVNVALARQAVTACIAGDVDGDALITIDEIIRGVKATLEGCAATPTSTPTVHPCSPTPAAQCAAACQLTGCCFQDGIQCFDPTIQCTPSAQATCRPGWYGYTACGNQGLYDDACQLSSTPGQTGTRTPTPTPPPASTPTATVTATSDASTPTVTVTDTPGAASPSPTATPTTTPSAGGSGLFDSIGIGADWGPHWSASASAIDPRDNQDDSAFPPEICLLANAGFQSIRMYGENVETWISVLRAVDAYNAGTLVCVPGQHGPPSQPLSVVYQVAICGPDPRSLEWNGSYASIDDVRCYDPQSSVEDETPFTQSLAAEVLKLEQVLRYAGEEFAAHVKLVFVGNEILFSRGTCGDGSACTDNGDCVDAMCTIAHYCSATLSAASPTAATTCTTEADCSSIDKGSCTDVTNLAPLRYAFDRVQDVLRAALGPMATLPAISISLQVDVMVAPAPGVTPPSSAPLLWSRQQLAAALPSKVVAVNTYPDQWGLVIAGQLPSCGVQSYPSCIDATNAVNGDLLPRCMADRQAYEDPVTGLVAHRIDTYYQLLTKYYPDYQVVIAETGWHTAGTCSGYNDCTADPTRYSPAAAATYFTDLYEYVQEKRLPLLVFEMFDQKTKTCTVEAGTAMGEANYGVFTNYCQLKGSLQALLPSGANLTAFDELLSPDGQGGKSCENQSLLTIAGVGYTGVCADDTSTPCLSASNCPSGNCVWGYCSNLTAQGCNPDDPNNPMGCGTCLRAGNCYDTTAPGGYYESTPAISCASDASCSSATCPFGACACFVAMAPATLSPTSSAEGPGMLVEYSNGTFQFQKGLGPLALVQPASGGTFIAQPLWNNNVVGANWTVNLLPPAGGTSGGSPSSCSNTASAVTPGPTSSISWQTPWACAYPPPPAPATPGTGITTLPISLSVPRTFLDPVPTWAAPPTPTQTPMG